MTIDHIPYPYDVRINGIDIEIVPHTFFYKRGIEEIIYIEFNIVEISPKTLKKYYIHDNSSSTITIFKDEVARVATDMKIFEILNIVTKEGEHRLKLIFKKR